MLLLHMQFENNFAVGKNSVVSKAFASNKMLHEAIADLKEYREIIAGRTTSPTANIVLLSVSEIDTLNNDELKFMGVQLIEGLLEAVKAKPTLSQ